jgi:hypothetical protein
LELLADFGLDMTVSGMEFGELAGIGVDAGESEFGFARGLHDLKEVEGALVAFRQFLALGVLFEHGGHEAMRRAKRGLTQAVKHSRQIYPSVGGSYIQNTKSSDYPQIARACRIGTITLVDEEQTRLLLYCKSYGVSFASIQMH